MNTYIVFFRGINVGGHHIIRMKPLREVLESLGFYNVRTYIQSGNVVFKSPIKEKGEITMIIQSKINDLYGFEPNIFVLTSRDINQAAERNPFPRADDDPSKVHLYFLKEALNEVDNQRLDELKAKTEEYKLIGDIFYLFAPEGVGRSKLAASVEKTLGVPTTARNWRTVKKTMAMIK